MTTATAAIANHLNIAEGIIASVEEWAHVLFVRFIGRRPRFVSKKVMKVSKEIPESVARKIKAAESQKANPARYASCLKGIEKLIASGKAQLKQPQVLAGNRQLLINGIEAAEAYLLANK